MRIENIEQLRGAIAFKIAQFDDNCGGMDKDYCLSFDIKEYRIDYVITFSWTYKIVTKGEEPNAITKEYNTERWFNWLKSESLVKLNNYIDDVLETVIKDKVSHERI